MTDLGVESLCCRVSIKDKGQAEVDTGDRTDIDRNQFLQNQLIAASSCRQNLVSLDDGISVEIAVSASLKI